MATISFIVNNNRQKFGATIANGGRFSGFNTLERNTFAVPSGQFNDRFDDDDYYANPFVDSLVTQNGNYITLQNGQKIRTN